jgi:hypothetical protein
VTVCYVDGVDNSQPKKRFPLGRVARLAFRTLALAMLVACVAGWVLSCRGVVHVSRMSRDHRQISLYSRRGHLAVHWFSLEHLFGNMPVPAASIWHADFHAPNDFPGRIVKPFHFGAGDPEFKAYSVQAPYWFLTTLAAMAAALSFKRTWRFTTHQLLIAMTAVALLLGAVAWSMRG